MNNSIDHALTAVPTQLVAGEGVHTIAQLRSYAGMFDRYAAEVIGDRAGDYNGIEIHGVCDLSTNPDEDGTCCEIDDINPQFFSVFAHLTAGGVDCVGDFEHYSHAVAYADELAATHRWPITDSVKALINGYVQRRTGEENPTFELVEPTVALSTGRTVFRRKMPNGSKEAFLLGGTLTSAEINEYTQRLRHNKDAMN